MLADRDRKVQLHHKLSNSPIFALELFNLDRICGEWHDC